MHLMPRNHSTHTHSKTHTHTHTHTNTHFVSLSLSHRPTHTHTDTHTQTHTHHHTPECPYEGKCSKHASLLFFCQQRDSDWPGKVHTILFSFCCHVLTAIKQWRTKTICVKSHL